MYEHSTPLIAALLFAGILAAVEIGFRLGRRKQGAEADAIRSHVSAIQAAALGVLGLLLAFTFSLSLSLQRHDSRSQAFVDEANAIGTAWLRAGLLPPAQREPAQALLRECLDVRIRKGRIDLASDEERAPLVREAARIADALWGQAVAAAESDGGPVRSGLFAQAMKGLQAAPATQP